MCCLVAAFTIQAQTPPCAASAKIGMNITGTGIVPKTIRGTESVIYICEDGNPNFGFMLSGSNDSCYNCGKYSWSAGKSATNQAPVAQYVDFINYKGDGSGNMPLVRNSGTRVELMSFRSEVQNGALVECMTLAAITVYLCVSTVGIEEQEMNTIPVRVQYFDLIGREVLVPVQNVLYIKRITYAGGKILTSKVVIQ